MSFFVDRETLLETGATVPSSPSQVAARAAWKTAGLTRTIRGRRTDAIQVDGSALQATLDAFLRAVGPAVADSINRHFVPVAMAAFDQWPAPPPGPPKRTGLSKSLLALEISISADGTELAAALVDRAPYALFIRRGATVRELIWNPGRDAAEPIADDILGALT